LFGRLEMIAEPVLIYRRGDTLAEALARVEAITRDPHAGRAQRDPVHPAIEPIADDLARPTRILLTELLEARLLGVELLDLADTDEDELTDRDFVMQVRLRWRSPTSARARAARAAGAYLQSGGVDLRTVALLPRSVLDHQDGCWVVDCREMHLRDLVIYLRSNEIADGLFMLRPERKRPLRAMRIRAPNPAALPPGDLEGWLSQRAPQIHPIG
jgi:hypothetical protein